MVYLKSIRPKPDMAEPDVFPFNLPLVRDLDELAFTAPVTFFIGENGSGKSTLLEGIAAAAGLPAVGGEEIETDETLAAMRRFGRALRLSWGRRTRRGFFLRAEDFFRFTRRMNRLVRELDDQIAEYDRTLTGYAQKLAKGAAAGQRAAIVGRYGEDLDANSHGESFLKLFQARLVPEGLYLLDEPEVPLSPNRLLTLLSMIKQQVEEGGAQFIIATHSPILMAYPGATIYSFDTQPVSEIAWEDVEHVDLTRRFLAAPERFLKHL